MTNAQGDIIKEFKDFLKECGGRFEREVNSNHFLITGMPRASGKTYTVLKGLLKILPEGRKLLYVARTIGAGLSHRKNYKKNRERGKSPKTLYCDDCREKQNL